MTFTTDGAALTNQLLVTTVVANDGLETITQQAPLSGPIYALPFFVNKDLENENEGDLDTILVLANVTSNSLPATITLWDASGMMIDTPITLTPALAGHETRTIFLSTLPP